MNDLIRRALDRENCPELVGRWSGRGTPQDPNAWRTIYAGPDPYSAERAFQRQAALVRKGRVEWWHGGVQHRVQDGPAKKGR